MSGNGKAAAVNRNAFPSMNTLGNTRSGDLQLGAAFGRADPEDGGNFFNQTGEHSTHMLQLIGDCHNRKTTRC